MDQDPVNPQSWNLYSYGRNNPLRFTDPTGRACQKTDNGTPYDDGTGGGCDAAGVDKKGKAFAYQVTVNDRGQMFTEVGGTTFELGDHGQRMPVGERPLQNDTANLVLNLFAVGDVAKVGVVVGTAGKDVLAELLAVRGAILADSTGQTTIRGGFQMFRAGGAAQAAKDFDALVNTGGSTVRNYGPVKATTLADGSEAVLRQSTTKGYAGTPTLEFRDNVGNMVAKVRY
jgi:hypothetical protein